MKKPMKGIKMTAQDVAERMIEHVVLHWDSIPDRENTIEQALCRMSNGLTSWPHVSNALIGKEVRPEILELMHRIVERLRKNEIQLGECTKPVKEFMDACINSEAIMMALQRIRQQPIIVHASAEGFQ